MRLQSGTLFFLVGLCCVVSLAGCQAFFNRSIDDPDLRLRFKKPAEGPASQRQPKSLDNLTGTNRPPVAPPVAPIEDPSQFAQTGISMDDVSLDKSAVHVENRIDIEDIQADAATQLPAIVESAVHPFQRMPPTTTLSDQGSKVTQPPKQSSSEAIETNSVVSQQPKSESSNPAVEQVEAVASQTAPIANSEPVVQSESTKPVSVATPVAQETQEHSQLPPPSKAEPIAQASPMPEASQSNSSHENELARRSEPSDAEVPIVKVPIVQRATPLMKMVADPSSSENLNQEDSITDHLFADLKNKRQGEVVIVSDQEIPGASRTVGASPRNRMSKTIPVSRDFDQDSVGYHQQVAQASLTAAPNGQRRHPGTSNVAWDSQLAAAINQLDYDLKRSEQAVQVSEEVKLQLLKIVAGQLDSEPIRIQSGDPSYRKYWNDQLSAIRMLLKETPGRAGARVAHAALQRQNLTAAAAKIEEAHGHLAGIAKMKLSQCAFASEVRGFGQFTPVSASLTQGQQVLIYCEIENYSLRESEIDGNLQQVAELKGQFSIVDSTNRVVFQHQYQKVTDVAQRRRKDFYMFFPMTVPNLPAGQYRLQLSVDDLVGDKVASANPDLYFNVLGGANRTATQAPTSQSMNASRGNQPLSINNQPLPMNSIPRSARAGHGGMNR